MNNGLVSDERGADVNVAHQGATISTGIGSGRRGDEWTQRTLPPKGQSPVLRPGAYKDAMLTEFLTDVHYLRSVVWSCSGTDCPHLTADACWSGCVSSPSLGACPPQMGWTDRPASKLTKQ